MMSKNGARVWGLAACLGLGVFAGAIQAEEPLTADAVLDRMAAAYQELESLEVEGLAFLDMTLPVGEMHTETRFLLRLARNPARYRIEWEQEAAGMNMPGAVWTGDAGPLMYHGMMNSYFPLDTHEMAIGGATGVSGGSAFTVPVLFFPEIMDSMLSDLNDASLEPGEYEAGGVPCYLVRGRASQAPDVRLWISKDDFLLRKIEKAVDFSGGIAWEEINSGEMDEALGALGYEEDAEEAEAMKSHISAMKEAMQDITGNMGETYNRISVNHAFEVSDLTYEVPEGTVRMESFYAAVQHMAAETMEDMDGAWSPGNAVVGEPALVFTAPRFGGGEIRLEDYRGNVVLLDFWATWCGPCIAELPELINLHEAFAGQGFQILGISLDDSEEALARFIERRPEAAWPQVFDGKGWANEVGELYDVQAIPYTVLIDREGIVRHVDLRGTRLAAAVAELLEDNQ